MITKNRIKKLEKILTPNIDSKIIKASEFVSQYVGCEGKTKEDVKQYYIRGALTGNWDWDTEDFKKEQHNE